MLSKGLAVYEWGPGVSDCKNQLRYAQNAMQHAVAHRLISGNKCNSESTTRDSATLFDSERHCGM